MPPDFIPSSKPIEERYRLVRQDFARGGQVTRDQVREVLGICGQLLDEQKRMRAALDRMAPAFQQVREGLAEIHRTVPQTERNNRSEADKRLQRVDQRCANEQAGATGQAGQAIEQWLG